MVLPRQKKENHDDDLSGRGTPNAMERNATTNSQAPGGMRKRIKKLNYGIDNMMTEALN
jgi:hypothetical protein